MKKIYLSLIISLIASVSSFNISYAEVGVTGNQTYTNTQSTTVYVTEKIPGANCDCYPDSQSCGDITTRKYKCTIEAGFGSFQKSIQGITGWFTQIALILSVLVVVLLGIAWAIWGSSEEKVKFLKGWTINILIGIVTLFFFQYILVMLAPQVFK